MNNNINKIKIKEFENAHQREIQYRVKMDHIKQYSTTDIINFFVHLFNYYTQNKTVGSFSISTMYAKNYKPIEIFFTEFDNDRYIKNAIFSADQIRAQPFKYLFVNVIIEQKNKIKDYYKLMADCFGMTVANKLVFK
jgi:hypothetical protein